MAIHLSGLLYNKHSTNIYLNANTYIQRYLKWLYANRVHKNKNMKILESALRAIHTPNVFNTLAPSVPLNSQQIISILL